MTGDASTTVLTSGTASPVMPMSEPGEVFAVVVTSPVTIDKAIGVPTRLRCKPAATIASQGVHFEMNPAC
jgi:hypothetical protein